MRPADAGEELGIYITLQSWVMVALYLRLLFYFRASEQFGALMHMVIVVFQQVKLSLRERVNTPARGFSKRQSCFECASSLGR
jgi:hypothetical protein